MVNTVMDSQDYITVFLDLVQIKYHILNTAVSVEDWP